VDREVIAQKLESLRRCLKRVEEKCPSEPDTLEREPDLQDIITLNLTRAVRHHLGDFTEFAKAISARITA